MMIGPKNFPEKYLPDHLKDVGIGVSAAWQAGYSGDNVGVALVDSGVDIREGYARDHLNITAEWDHDIADSYRREDYSQTLRLGGDFAGSGGRRPYVDRFGHGTKMASIIGARPGYDGVVGIVPKIRLFNYKVADRLGKVRKKSLRKAIERILGEHREKNIRVVLFPLDRKVWANDKGLVDNEFPRLHDAGLVTIVAASDDNSDLDESQVHPAKLGLSSVLVVAAHDRNRRLTPDSNFGAKTVHLAAPGRGVASVSPMAPVPAYGSSAASAIVAGVAALLCGRFAEQSAEWICQQLCTLVGPLAPRRQASHEDSAAHGDGELTEENSPRKESVRYGALHLARIGELEAGS